MAISSRSQYLLIYDNTRSLTLIWNDTLCVVSTGGSIGSRRLYTDDEESFRSELLAFFGSELPENWDPMAQSSPYSVENLDFTIGVFLRGDQNRSIGRRPAGVRPGPARHRPEQGWRGGSDRTDVVNIMKAIPDRR